MTASVLPSGLSASPVTAWWLAIGAPIGRRVRAFHSRIRAPAVADREDVAAG